MYVDSSKQQQKDVWGFCADNCYETANWIFATAKLKLSLVLLFLSLLLWKCKTCIGFWQIGLGIFFKTVSWSFKRGYGEERNWATVFYGELYWGRWRLVIWGRNGVLILELWRCWMLRAVLEMWNCAICNW